MRGHAILRRGLLGWSLGRKALLLSWAGLLALAGCLGPAPAPAASVPGPCAAAAPDGSALACDAWPWAQARLEPPGPTEGWFCAIDHDDEAPMEFFRLFTHRDGRLAYSWRSFLPPGGEQFIVMGIAQPGANQTIVLPFQPEGFAEYPFPPEPREGVAVIRMHRLLLHELVDGAWQPVEGARLAYGTVDGGPYFAWQLPSPDGGATAGPVIDLMGDPVEDLPEPGDRVVEIAGRTYSAASSGRGSDFESAYWGLERAAAGDCWPEQMPGGLR